MTPMKRALLYFLFFSIIIPTQAQILPSGVELKKGATQYIRSGNQIDKFIFHNEDKSIALDRSGSKLTFYSFDDKLNSKVVRTEELNIEFKELTFEKVVVIDEKIYVFSSYYDVDTFMTTLYKQELDKETLKLSTPEIFYSNETDEEIGKSNYHMAVSENAEWILLDVAVKVEEEKGEKEFEVFDVIVYNKDFEESWKLEEVQISDEETKMRRYNYQISNAGTVAMLASASSFGGISGGSASITINNINDLMTILDAAQRFIVTIKKDKDPVLYELKLEEYKLLTIKYVFNLEDKISLVGIYKGKESKERGFYYAQLNNEKGEFDFENLLVFGDMNGVINPNSHAMDPQVAEALRLTSSVRPGFKIHDLFSDKDGVTMVGESVFSDYSNSTSYFYGIAVVKFNNSGEIEWRQGVPKIQYGAYKMSKYNSYGMLRSGSKISFIFNFLPYDKTGGNVEGKSWMAKKASDIYLAQVDGGGEVTIDLLMEGTKKPYWIPRRYYQIADGELLFIGGDGKSTSLTKVSVSSD
jgi:hypothetical protein